MLKNSLFIAFSMYSKIPVPDTEWNERNMKYAMCFFPLVGAVTGAFLYAWCLAARFLAFGSLLTAAGYVVIPLLVTGGIHLDGFLDTQDALSSYRTREEKLAILKDPHTGAFALISCLIYAVMAAGVWSELKPAAVMSASIGCILSRALSGLAAVTFPAAKKSGLLHTFTDRAHKRRVRAVMVCYIAAALAGMVCTGGYSGAGAVLLSGAAFWYYARMSKKQFGGITGDLAGWFLQVCELLIIIGALAGQIFTEVAG